MNGPLVTIDTILDLLEKIGRYSRRQSPLHIAGISYSFDFEAVLEGPGDEHNLVFVCSYHADHAVDLERRIRAVSTGLRRTGSLRTFTLVLIEPPPDDMLVTALEAYCRVLPVHPEVLVSMALAPLLPLPVPAEGPTMVKATDALKDELGAKFVQLEVVIELMKAAGTDASSVEKAALARIRAVATSTSGMEEG